MSTPFRKLLLLVTVGIFIGKSHALPPNFSFVEVTAGLKSPVALSFAPDGRAFITEQAGRVRIVKNGVLLPTAFHTVNTAVSNEEGLLNIAVHPKFSKNGYIYINRTVVEGVPPALTRYNQLSRLRAVPPSADVSNGIEEVILRFENRLSNWHAAGAIAFGPDGHLYMSIGENAVRSKSQDLESTLLGKIIRVDDNGQAVSGNPFFNSTNPLKRKIWAWGLRNPFSLDFNDQTGALLFTDSGENSWEEINEVDGSGRNFGWPVYGDGNLAAPGITAAIEKYPHGPALKYSGCAIVSGVFFDPVFTNWPTEYQGTYFYRDWCRSWIRSLKKVAGVWQPGIFHHDPNGLAADEFTYALGMTTGLDGNLYFLARQGWSGRLMKIVYVPGASIAPTITRP